VLIHALPIYHTHGLFVATNVTLLAGASMIFLPKFDAEALIRAHAARDRADGRADLLHAPARPTRLTNRERRRHMRLFISGSAPLLAETHREWSARTGHASSNATA
jgi:malonyl-CoA/methylmalonyl-CoA synthetase